MNESISKMTNHIFQTEPFKKAVKKKYFKKKFKTDLREKINDYCINTTIHGLKYVGLPNLNACEKSFFGMSIILVLCLSAYFITDVYMKWNQTPIIVSLDSRMSQSKDYPFPAITICNMNQAMKSLVTNISVNTLEHSVLSSLCYHRKVNLTTNRDIYGRWSYVKKFLMNVSQPCSHMLKNCVFGGIAISCKEIFTTVLTDEGVCCTFNGLDQKWMFNYNSSDNSFDYDYVNLSSESYFWTPERGYVDSRINTFKKTPRRIPGTGTHMGLTVVLNVSLQEYYCSSTNSYGFKALIHNPVEIPKLSNFGMLISPAEEVRISFTPEMYVASESIKKVPQSVRQCLFENESPLEYFSVYTKRNCEMECEAAITEMECKCRELYMPKFDGNVRICDQRDAGCYNPIKFRTDYFGDESFFCNCMPACFEIGYYKEISVAPLLNNEMLNADKRENYNRNEISILHVFLKDASFRSYTKTEFIGLTEFLCKPSNTGGLLGLFLGFSVISVTEIIYFCTIRPYYMKKREKQLHNRLFKYKSSALNNSKEKRRQFIYKYPAKVNTPHKIFFKRNTPITPYID